MIYPLSYFLCKFLQFLFFPTKYHGLEKIRSLDSYIIASNHMSNLDPFILGVSQWRSFSFVAKEELFKSRISSFLLKGMGAFPIKRDKSDFRAIRETLRRLKNGTPIILFPEGTRGVGGRQKKVQSGVGLIAVKSGLPVIPAYIENSEKALPDGAKWFKRHPVTVTFGSPLTFSKDQSYDVITDQIMEKIYALPINSKHS